MKIINLFAGPGVGKSTTVAGLFYLLKHKGYRCEMSLEYAKDCVWEERSRLLEDQVYIFAKQLRRLVRLKSHKLDYVITDSPLLFSLIYASAEPPSFFRLVYDKFEEFENINFVLNRTKTYMKYGRGQSEEEARVLDKKILEMVVVNNLTYRSVDGDEQAPEKILKLLGI